MEFMTPQNSYPVEYTLRPVGDDAGPYPPDGGWADPDIGHAARLMRHVFEDQGEAGERGRRAAEDLRRNHSAEAAGKAMAERIRRVRARLGAGPEAGRPLAYSPAGLDTNPLTHRIATTPQPKTSSSTLGRVLAPFRRVLLKLMWPFALQQRAVNEELLATAKEVDQSLRAALNQLESRYAKGRADLLGAVNHNREQARMQGERLDRLERRLAETAGDTSAPQTSSAAGTGGFSRQAISRLVTPFTAQQQKINDQLFTAVRTLGEKLGGLVPRVEA